MMVDVNRGNKLACLSTPSFLKRLEELLILFLEDLILYCYLVVLSLQLLDFSLKSELLSFLLSFLLSQPHTRRDGGVVLCVMASFTPHVGEGCLVKRECTYDGNQLDKAEKSRNRCVSHRRRQMLMHKISEDFGTTESVKFVNFAILLRSLVWISM
ncbi:hypothetical protein ACFX2I_037197 [Malus domestica]